MIFLSQMVPINKTLPLNYSFFLATLDSERSFDLQRDLLIWDRDLFSIFCTFVHWNFSKHFFATFRSEVRSSEIWIRVFGLRVQDASHYTIEPISFVFSKFELFPMSVGFMTLFEKNCSLKNDILLPNVAKKQNIAYMLLVFFSRHWSSERSFDSQRVLLICDRDLFSHFLYFCSLEFFKTFFRNLPFKSRSTEIWTRVFRFRVQGASHYTTEPITLFFEIWIVPNVCWLHDPFWKELFGKKWYFRSQMVPRNRTLPNIYSFSPDIGFRAQFWFTTRFTKLRSRLFFPFFILLFTGIFQNIFSKLFVQK